MASETPLTTINLPGQRLRRLAKRFLDTHPLHSSSTSSKIFRSSSEPHIRVVCISDTHNRQPDLPPGDLLIHAGDLTENGSFEEIQTQLHWLSSQPYQHKILIAGNHDVLLDEDFLDKYPERRYGQTKTLRDLDWGSVHYLQDSSITLDITLNDPNDTASSWKRPLTIFGSPWTPQYVPSAFQYPADQDIWTGKIPQNADIVITYGPPYLHLDIPGFCHAGCPYLAKEIFNIWPPLVVFGHIHASYGREDIILDRTRRAHDGIFGNWGGWGIFAVMCGGVCLARTREILFGRESMLNSEKVTTLVNASVVRESWNEDINAPFVVEL